MGIAEHLKLSKLATHSTSGEKIAANYAKNEQAAEAARLWLTTISPAFSAAGRRDLASLKDATLPVWTGLPTSRSCSGCRANW